MGAKAWLKANDETIDGSSNFVVRYQTMVNFEQKRSRPRPAWFLAEAEKFRADSCEPLKSAVARKEIAFNALARGAYPGTALPPKTLEGITTVGYWDAKSNQTWGLDWHRNEGIELTYLARGRIAFAVDNTAFPLSHGHLTVTRPWQLHRVGNPLDSRQSVTLDHSRFES